MAHVSDIDAAIKQIEKEEIDAKRQIQNYEAQIKTLKTKIASLEAQKATHHKQMSVTLGAIKARAPAQSRRFLSPPPSLSPADLLVQSNEQKDASVHKWLVNDQKYTHKGGDLYHKDGKAYKLSVSENGNHQLKPHVARGTV